jgi:hypothetical protein
MKTKQLFIRTFCCIFFANMLLLTTVAQNTIEGVTTVCPKTTEEYSIWTTDSILVWTVQNGRFSNNSSTITTSVASSGYRTHKVSVTWNNIGANSQNTMPRGKITTNTGRELNVTILSVKDWKTSVTIDGDANPSNYTISYGSTASILVSATQYYPHTTATTTGITNTLRTEWTVPTNILSSPSSTPNSPFITDLHSIQITPANGCATIDGKLRVRATNWTCATHIGNDTGYYGAYREITIKRDTPNPTLTTSLSNNTIPWGTQPQITFTAGGTPTADSYVWEILDDNFVEPRGIQSETSRAITLTHKGCNQGTVRVKAVYCGNKESTWRTAFVNVTDPPTTIHGDGILNSPKDYTIPGLPAGTTVHWTTGGYIYPSSATTTSNHSVLFSPAISSGCFESQINATAVRNGCSRIISPRYLGVGFVPIASAISSLYNGQTISTSSPYFEDVITYYGQVLWPNPHNITGGGWQSKVGSGLFPEEWDCMSPAPPSGTCARIQINVSSRPFLLQARLQNSCGWSSWVDIQYDGGGGAVPPTCINGTPYCTGWCSPCQPPPPICPLWCQHGCYACIGYCTRCHDDDCDGNCNHEFTFFPNPVSDELTIDFVLLSSNEIFSTNTEKPEEITYSIKLIDNTGVVQRETKHKHRRGDRQKSSIKFNVSRLKEGTYFLHVESNGKIHKEQIIVKRK